jgi:hypothetical protein
LTSFTSVWNVTNSYSSTKNARDVHQASVLLTALRTAADVM